MPLQRPRACVTIQSLNERPRRASVPITPQDSWRARCIFQGCILHLKDAFSTSVAVSSEYSGQESREEDRVQNFGVTSSALSRVKLQRSTAVRAPNTNRLACDLVTISQSDLRGQPMKCETSVHSFKRISYSDT